MWRHVIQRNCRCHCHNQPIVFHQSGGSGASKKTVTDFTGSNLTFGVTWFTVLRTMLYNKKLILKITFFSVLKI
jgi:cytochrome oxidase assembly protein ShyY1